MTIRPPQSGQTSRTPLQRANSSAVPAAPQRQSDAAPAPALPAATARDAVQISAQARQLQKTDGASREDAGALAPDRLRTILQRMSDGHYDRPEVQDAVLKRIVEELQ
ncbi:MAG: hypothetical protein U0704_08025 [Candidatus Eisenbacteria bacterium]